MTAEEIKKHNEECEDDEIIWCECELPLGKYLCCSKCGGALPGIVIVEDRANDF